jgi:hypothetical protein
MANANGMKGGPMKPNGMHEANWQKALEHEQQRNLATTRELMEMMPYSEEKLLVDNSAYVFRFFQIGESIKLSKEHSKNVQRIYSEIVQNLHIMPNTDIYYVFCIV